MTPRDHEKVGARAPDRGAPGCDRRLLLGGGVARALLGFAVALAVLVPFPSTTVARRARSAVKTPRCRCGRERQPARQRERRNGTSAGRESLGREYACLQWQRSLRRPGRQSLRAGDGRLARQRRTRSPQRGLLARHQRDPRGRRRRGLPACDREIRAHAPVLWIRRRPRPPLGGAGHAPREGPVADAGRRSRPQVLGFGRDGLRPQPRCDLRSVQRAIQDLLAVLAEWMRDAIHAEPHGR